MVEQLTIMITKATAVRNCLSKKNIGESSHQHGLLMVFCWPPQINSMTLERAHPNMGITQSGRLKKFRAGFAQPWQQESEDNIYICGDDLWWLRRMWLKEALASDPAKIKPPTT